MKDIYIIMAHQNILTFYSRKLDIRVDKSQYFDYEEDKQEKYDLKIDNSEYYDFELDYSPDYELITPNIPIVHKLVLSVNFETEDYFITDMSGIILTTQGYDKIQFQF
jgi:hypothetical protein